MFFIDKYKPNNIDDIEIHKNILQKLSIMSKDDSVPHIIFYGPEGVGKKTIINFFLEMIYNEQVHKLKDTVYNISGSGSSTSEEIIKQSNYHIVVEPKNTNFDRYLIQDVVKEYARTIPLNVFTAKKKFKTVLINNIGNLSYYAQTSLRRTMETFSKTCRFIMWTRSLSQVIEPLRSRCYCIRIPAPTDKELFKQLYKISINENIKINFNNYQEIINKSKGNIKTALWLLELKKRNDNFITDYDKVINFITKCLLTANINKVLIIRDSLYSVMITNIDGTVILKDLTDKLVTIDSIPNECKYKIINAAAKCEHRLRMGRREIIHLELFIINVIFLLNNSK